MLMRKNNMKLNLIAGEEQPPLITSPSFEIIGESRDKQLDIIEVRYSVDTESEVPALILRSNLYSTHKPCIALHQTTQPNGLGKREPAGIAGKQTLHYGRELAENGYVVICPDYPLFGDYEVSVDNIYHGFGYSSMTMKGVNNHKRAIDLLRFFGATSCEKVLCVGHSLGASNCIFLASFDQRIAGVISSAGFSSFKSYSDSSKTHDLTGWARRDKYMPYIYSRYGSDYRRMPLDFDDIISALCPTPIFVNAPLHDDVFRHTGALEAYIGARRDYEAHGAGDKLMLVEPDSNHDFPIQYHSQAYDFIGQFI